MSLFRLEKNISRINTAIFNTMWDDDERPFICFPEQWHIGYLLVDPAFQRQGIGSQLMQKVLELTKSEGVPLSLNASRNGRLLYQEMGFEDIQINKVAESVEGMAMMWIPVRAEQGISPYGFTLFGFVQNFNIYIGSEKPYVKC